MLGYEFSNAFSLWKNIWVGKPSTYFYSLFPTRFKGQLKTTLAGHWLFSLSTKEVFAELFMIGVYTLLVYSAVLTVRRAPILGELALLCGAIEILFYLFQRQRYHARNHSTAEFFNTKELTLLQERFLKLRDVFRIEDFLEGWFHGAPVSSIKRGNVLELIAYGFYTLEYEGLSDSQQQEVELFLKKVESTWDIQFPEGRNADIQFMSHIWEPLRVWHKPLLNYVVFELMGLVASLLIQLVGFTRYHHNGFDYYVRKAGAAAGGSREFQKACDTAVSNALEHELGGCITPETPSKTDSLPIVFCHGIGFGLVPYVPMLKAIIARCPNSTILLVEARHVSLQLSRQSRSVDEVVNCIADVLKVLAYDRACFVAHSYGTFVASRMCQVHKECVACTVLMDPVCLMTCYPTLLQNFIYKSVAWSNILSFRGLINGVIFLCSRELLIADAFCRKFCWRALMLWPQDMPKQSLVTISGNDDLVPGRLIHAQLRLEGVAQVHLCSASHTDESLEQGRNRSMELIAFSCHSPCVCVRHSAFPPNKIYVCCDNAAHGGVLFDMGWQQEILDAITHMVHETNHHT